MRCQGLGILRLRHQNNDVPAACGQWQVCKLWKQSSCSACTHDHVFCAAVRKLLQTAHSVLHQLNADASLGVTLHILTRCPQAVKVRLRIHDAATRVEVNAWRRERQL
jgi:hypothetical protein